MRHFKMYYLRTFHIIDHKILRNIHQRRTNSVIKDTSLLSVRNDLNHASNIFNEIFIQIYSYLHHAAYLGSLGGFQLLEKLIFS